MRKAFAYLRVSTEGQVDKDGFIRQQAAIESYARSHDVEIVRFFEEKGVSGTEYKRPALTELMSELLSDGIQLVLIEKLDRLARDLMVQERIIADLRHEKIELISTCEPDLCVDDPTRKLMRQIMGAIAEWDKSMLVAKLQAARRRSQRKQGRKPFADKGIIARMKNLKEQGLNYPAIAKKLNSEGHKTQTGSKWFPASVSRTLARV